MVSPREAWLQTGITWGILHLPGASRIPRPTESGPGVWASFWGFKQRQDVVRCMFQSPTPLAGELLGTGWKRTGSESLSLFLPRTLVPPFARGRQDFPGAAGGFGHLHLRGREPSRCGQQALRLAGARYGAGGGLPGPLASGVRIRALSPPLPSEWN